MIESCCIIYGLFIVIFDFGYLFNYYSVSSFSIMELLISIFLIIFPFILSLNQLLKLSIESSKGIYSIFLNYFPYFTIYILTNDFLILNQFNKYARCINLGDLIALLGSIDFVLGSIDLYLILLFILFILLLSMLLILFSVTSIFSIIHFILLSDNFECGFYPRLLSMLKYKFNYWILTIYFLIFEQELILILLLTFSISTFNEYLIILFLLGILLLELF